MKKTTKIIALLLCAVMMLGIFAGCQTQDPTTTGSKPQATNPSNPTDPSEPDPTDPPADPKKEYKITVIDSEGNPVSGVLVQICKEGSTCFTPTRTNDQGVATWSLNSAADYYGTVSSTEEGMPKEYFGEDFEVTLVYNPPVAE